MSPLEAAKIRFKRAEQELEQAARALCRLTSRELMDKYLRRMPPDALRKVRIIQQLVADFHKVEIDLLLSPYRANRVVVPRQQAMTISHLLVSATLEEIGEAFIRDHGTVIYAMRAVKEHSELEPEYAAQLATLTAQCRAAIEEKNAA